MWEKNAGKCVLVKIGIHCFVLFLKSRYRRLTGSCREVRLNTSSIPSIEDQLLWREFLDPVGVRLNTSSIPSIKDQLLRREVLDPVAVRLNPSTYWGSAVMAGKSSTQWQSAWIRQVFYLFRISCYGGEVLDPVAVRLNLSFEDQLLWLGSLGPSGSPLGPLLLQVRCWKNLCEEITLHLFRIRDN
jgi:hypothetical protein